MATNSSEVPLTTLATEERDGAIAEDIRIADVPGGEIEAWLVRPPKPPSGGCPGLVQWHWLDTEAPDGNRSEFLADARALARRGVVSVLPQGRFPWQRPPTGATADIAEIEAEVARFGRLVDLLAGRPEVDAGRLGAVGHDFGAMLATIAAARDPRIGGLVLIAPTPRWGDWFLPFWRIVEDRIDYLRALRPLDPVEQIVRVPPRPILLQLARRDFYIPLMAGFELRRAAAGESGEEALELKTYDAGHDLHVQEATADRMAFLERLLRLDGASDGD